MSRTGDHDTAVAAAKAIEPRLRRLHAQVLSEFQRHGAMNDEQLERLPVFAKYGPSTIRKRRSELYQCGQLAVVGESINAHGKKMKVWNIARAGRKRKNGNPTEARP